MKKTELVSRINQALIQNKVTDVLKGMAEYVGQDDNYLANALILLQSRNNSNEKSYLSGLRAEDQYELTKNRIIAAIQSYFEMLPEEGNEVLMNSSTNVEKKTILFLRANPKDKVTLNLEYEMRKIKDMMQAASHRTSFDMITEEAVRFDTITGAFMEHNPHVIHFSGHGDREGGLAIEDNSGNVDLFPNTTLDLLFKSFGKRVECVILNACYTRPQAELISQTRKEGVYVIGTENSISDGAATELSRGFYQALGAGKTYEEAFDMARVYLSKYLAGNKMRKGQALLWFNGKRIA